MAGKLIEFDKAERMLREHAGEKNQDVLKNRRLFVGKATDLVIEEAAFKARLMESVLSKYHDAIGGEKDIVPVEDHTGDFLELPVRTILAWKKDVIPITVDTVSSITHIAGLVKLPKEENSSIAKFAPHIIREINGHWERYNEQGEWEPTEITVPEISEEEAKILEKGGTEAELLKLIMSTSGDDATQEEIMENFNANKILTGIRAELQGMTVFTMLPGKRYAIVPRDWTHTGIAITAGEERYEVRQCITGGFRSILNIDEKEKGNEEAEFMPVVAKTKKEDVAKRVLISHIISRSGLENAITVPLSANNSICITGNSAETLLQSFVNQVDEEKNLTFQEKQNAELFANHLSKL